MVTGSLLNQHLICDNHILIYPGDPTTSPVPRSSPGRGPISLTRFHQGASAARSSWLMISLSMKGVVWSAPSPKNGFILYKINFTFSATLAAFTCPAASSPDAPIAPTPSTPADPLTNPRAPPAQCQDSSALFIPRCFKKGHLL